MGIVGRVRKWQSERNGTIRAGDVVVVVVRIEKARVRAAANTFIGKGREKK